MTVRKQRSLACVIAVASYWHEPQERALSLFDDCSQRENGERLKDPDLFYTAPCGSPSRIPLSDSTFWGEGLIETEENSFRVVPNLGPVASCCWVGITVISKESEKALSPTPADAAC